jgi:hypothetical protein
LRICAIVFSYHQLPSLLSRRLQDTEKLSTEAATGKITMARRNNHQNSRLRTRTTENGSDGPVSTTGIGRGRSRVFEFYPDAPDAKVIHRNVKPPEGQRRICPNSPEGLEIASRVLKSSPGSMNHSGGGDSADFIISVCVLKQRKKRRHWLDIIDPPPKSAKTKKKPNKKNAPSIEIGSTAAQPSQTVAQNVTRLPQVLKDLNPPRRSR